ncbi:hypothetical protein MCOR25_006442 [Pyricularia grisea]|uniref:Uncharacterized protein n=1 Tax=Pyricularia grisea TaxID=148305 RepID=A0A6P8BE41_PYRGI|nr:uncharacterized protein PgNI_05052 [Pyricularia grisea]KAI6361602.1 hypothetical protein MCOR25_006442 [Pyricularia grisea]TLD14019.1 hypothetical protein PgNI_05052 [Pyricularia grisea]
MSSTTKYGENGSDTSSSGGDSSSSGNSSSSSSSTGSETSNTSNTASGGQVPEPTQCGICKEWYALGDAHTCDLNDPYAGYYA